MKILIDNGHGVNTGGKCSPDRKLREYAYNREIATRIVAALKASGIDAERIVTEETDISLGERCRRVNHWCNKLGKSNVLLISVHVNAAGSTGMWRTAGGWSAYTTRGKTKSDEVATLLYESAQALLTKYVDIMKKGKEIGVYDQKQKPFRTDFTDGDPDHEADFYIINNTACPAVLTENLFMDNRADMEFLLSEEGKQTITDIHVSAIKKYISK